jgi:hypothetical protein
MRTPAGVSPNRHPGNWLPRHPRRIRALGSGIHLIAMKRNGYGRDQATVQAF